MKNISQLKEEMVNLKLSRNYGIKLFIDNLEDAIKRNLAYHPEAESITVIIPDGWYKTFVDEVANANYYIIHKGEYFNVETGNNSILCELKW